MPFASGGGPKWPDISKNGVSNVSFKVEKGEAYCGWCEPGSEGAQKTWSRTSALKKHAATHLEGLDERKITIEANKAGAHGTATKDKIAQAKKEIINVDSDVELTSEVNSSMSTPSKSARKKGGKKAAPKKPTMAQKPVKKMAKVMPNAAVTRTRTARAPRPVGGILSGLKTGRVLRSKANKHSDEELSTIGDAELGALEADAF